MLHDRDTTTDRPEPGEPIAVPIKEAQRLLGDKSRSEVYIAIGRGELDAVKDGQKTLITVASIRRRQAALPPAKIKPYTPREARRLRASRR
jgi:hypothetical protein